MASNERYRYGSGGSESEDDVSLDENVSPQEENAFSEIHPVFDVRKPRDPRSSAYHKYNIFSRLLFL